MAERKLKLGSDDLQILWGEVYIPNIPDSDGDYMTADDIREMAYKFMKSGRLGNIDIRHNNRAVKGAHLVESFIARKGDPDFIEGSWVAGVHIPDKDAWAMAKKGELNGFSIEALVAKTPTEIEFEVPPIISGKTMKHGEGSEAHDHEFHVAYDEKGNFLGGKTSISLGHFHIIKRGTISEESAGHRHRFSYIDSLLKE